MPMPRSRDRASDDQGQAEQPPPASFLVNEQSPLVIVSEQGRHSEASRRLVRAQAARASAAASRLTRARNREDREREGGARSEGLISPGVSSPPSGVSSQVSSPPPPATAQNSATQSRASQYNHAPQSDTQPRSPLVEWILSVITNPMEVLRGGRSLLNATPNAAQSSFSGVTSAMSPMAIANTLQTPRMGESLPFGARPGGNIQLPLALPKGFAALQQRLILAEGFVLLVSRTACFDFASQGVEQRMHQLLLDIIMCSTSAASLPNTINFQQPGHPIQSHIRIACASLTIYQGWRADGAFLTNDNSYRSGLDAAWLEVTMLDQAALKEQKSAEASLWAVFVISVTTGKTADFFHALLGELCERLNLRKWEQVRSILLDFIYPVSFLDEPCRQFWQRLCDSRISLA